MKIQFEAYRTLFLLHLFKVVNHFLGQNHIFGNPPMWNRNSLRWINDLGQKRSHTVHNDFGYNFIVEVTQIDGLKLVKVARILPLWDQCYISVITAPEKPLFSEKILYRRHHLRSNN